MSLNKDSMDDHDVFFPSYLLRNHTNLLLFIGSKCLDVFPSGACALKSAESPWDMALSGFTLLAKLAF